MFRRLRISAITIVALLAFAVSRHPGLHVILVTPGRQSTDQQL